MDYYTVAKSFWKRRKEYPNYPHTLQRRLIDTNIIAPIVYEYKSVFDMGCGDGSMLLALREFTNINMFYGCDISQNMLNSLHDKWGSFPGLNVFVGDATSMVIQYNADVFMSLGMFPYIFNDEDLKLLFDKVDSKVIIIRTPCTLNKEDEIINKYSEELGDNYSAIYRTKNNYLDILSSRFIVKDYFRAYPDSIESKYGTKHLFFICYKR